MNCTKCNTELRVINTDSRQEWTEYAYECPKCNNSFIRKIEYNQNGLITSDEMKKQ